MVRASRSAQAKIAEGYGRINYQENIQFCRPARGSLYELIDHFTAAEEWGYLDPATCTQIIEKIKAAIIDTERRHQVPEKPKTTREITDSLFNDFPIPHSTT
jgi:hypothetical protein